MNKQVLETGQASDIWPIQFRDFFGLKETIFAFFLLAGLFKAIPILEDFPFDLTVLSALATLGFVIHSVWRSDERRVGALFLLLGFFLIFAPTLLWTSWHDYAVEKASRFYTLTLLAAVAPLYLLRTREELRRFLCALTLLSTVVVVGALANLLTVGKDVERLFVFSASTIALARSVGVVFLFVTVWYVKSRASFLLVAVAVITLVILLVAAGERGPILATAFALIATYLLFQRKSWLGWGRAVLLILLVMVIFRYSMSWIPGTSLLRIGTFFGGELGESEFERVDYFRFSLGSIPQHPWGVGLGGFANLYGAENSADRVFPHNIFLETLLEGGWLAGLYLAVLFWRALRGAYFRALKKIHHPEFQFLFALLLFFIANEQVSGELNDSKALFAFVGLSVGFGVWSYEKGKSRAPHLRASAVRPAHIS